MPLLTASFWRQDPSSTSFVPFNSADNMPDRPGRLGRRRPFSSLMKKLASLKAASSGDGNRLVSSKRGASKKRQNNPYPQSGLVGVPTSSQNSQSRYSVSSGTSRRPSTAESYDSVERPSDEQPPPTAGARSMALTIATDHETARSIAAASLITGTTRTATYRGGRDSTFSSPAPSVRSLTTTLTTIQTTAHGVTGGHQHQHSHHNSQVIQFSQPFPTTPASAIPAHLQQPQPAGHPITYAAATANGLLTDNASILTLASSSKRRRRRSLDTDASTRALPPSSLWGGSRESLPLSVLSANLDNVGSPNNTAPNGVPGTPGLHRSGTLTTTGERASIYSATGILAAATAGERSSLHARQGLNGGADAASVRSGLLGHGRADSASGSVLGFGVGTSASATATSPLATPKEGHSATEDEGSGHESSGMGREEPGRDDKA
ncbi:uncharacterized protein CTHT_0015540 [Thermochaetoides thermophila DSM 1495]|uniref:Uncharacterized protein n=1 Tax=Chaetomium thermophilum (strain DSM 1495 / CBS 144.50 / IMI 039719) TaxID=759272 RepID=G0S208_CHATD|nr:hypothetical protein CTHT_0015540 [Thermochaetoides thermophila DSM 1495]EGS23068.1 hypothetical protein CTHT_0015540 [Thermochaetoides thermophila DSM 1495]